MLLKPFKGSISWDKASGIISASGVVPPSDEAVTTKIGDSVEVQMCASNLCRTISVGFGTIIGQQIAETILAETPTLRLEAWSCIPIGWSFSATNSHELPRVLGEYRSIFGCEIREQALSTDNDITDFIKRLVLFSTSKIRETTSPYALSHTGWWRLSDVVNGWSIPDLANVYIESLQAVSAPFEYQIVNKYVPLANILFNVDAISKVVSIANLPDIEIARFQEVQRSIKLLADYTIYDSADFNGLKGYPHEDPRESGPGFVTYEIDYENGDSVKKISLVDKLTRRTWFDDSMCSTSIHVLHLLEKLGPQPIRLDDKLIEYMSKLVISVTETSKFYDIIDTAFKNDLEFFEAYNTDKAISETDRYVFNTIHPDVTPYTHRSPLLKESTMIDAKGNDVVVEKLCSKLGLPPATLKLSVLGIELSNSINDLEQYAPVHIAPEHAADLGKDSPVAKWFEEQRYTSCRYTVATSYINELCEASRPNIPYTFEHNVTITMIYQAGPFVLNLNSLFWITPDAADNLAALDPQGTRVWLGPMDDPTTYAFMAVAMSTLYELLRKDPTDDMLKSICVFSSLGYLFRESDIVLAAIADELSLESPQEYLESYDQYITYCKRWFAGTFARLQGLQYSFYGRHKGMEAALSLIAERHGKEKMESIYERLFPGTKIENLGDSSGGAYCLDMLHWILDNGLVRMAGVRDPSEGSDTENPFVRYTYPLCEQKIYEETKDGVKTVFTQNLITGDGNMNRTPVAGHPEYKYIAPNFVQLSTLKESSDREDNSGHFMSQTSVMDWDRLFTLKSLFESKILGKKIYTIAVIEDMTDAPDNTLTRIAELLSDPTVKQVKLIVESENSIALQYVVLGTGDLGSLGT